MIRLDTKRTLPFLHASDLARVRDRAVEAHERLLERSGAGSEFLGWRSLAESNQDQMIRDVIATAREVRSRADVLLCIGIGGSYLGAEAVIRALSPHFGALSGGIPVLFAGHHLGGRYIADLLAHLEGRSVYVNVISKSGTTLEPAIAFRLVRRWLESRFDDADERIIVTTDPDRGALNEMHRRRRYRKFVIPPDVGGRFSVLTPVGLLPISCAGVDVEAMMSGAHDAAHALQNADENPALEYAAVRTALHQRGFSIELLAAFDPRFAGVQAWWQQLFGESEGKDGKGLYPDAVAYTTDLHSLGQYVQDGSRILLETFLMMTEDDAGVIVPGDPDDADGLNYLADRTLSEINRMAYEGTAEAHAEGGVPNMTIWTERLSPASIGEVIYFFEHAVAVSGYLLGINPFDQPGVEAYKRNMFRLLGRA